MKLIDFDEKFNKKVAEMLEKHAGERTEGAAFSIRFCPCCTKRMKSWCIML